MTDETRAHLGALAAWHVRCDHGNGGGSEEAHRLAAAAIRSLMERPSEPSEETGGLALEVAFRLGQNMERAAPAPGKTADPYERADAEAYLEHPRPPLDAPTTPDPEVVPASPETVAAVMEMSRSLPRKAETAGEAECKLCDEGVDHGCPYVTGKLVASLRNRQGEVDRLRAERDGLKAIAEDKGEKLDAARSELAEARREQVETAKHLQDFMVREHNAEARAERAEAALAEQRAELTGKLIDQQHAANTFEERALKAEAALADAEQAAASSIRHDWNEIHRLEAALAVSVRREDVVAKLRAALARLPNVAVAQLGSWLRDLTMDAGTGETAAEHLRPCPQHPEEIAAGWGHMPCDCWPHRMKRLRAELAEVNRVLAAAWKNEDKIKAELAEARKDVAREKADADEYASINEDLGRMLRAQYDRAENAEAALAASVRREDVRKQALEDIKKRWQTPDGRWCTLCDHCICTEDCPVSIAIRGLRDLTMDAGTGETAKDERLCVGCGGAGDIEGEEEHPDSNGNNRDTHTTCADCGGTGLRADARPAGKGTL